MCCRTLHSTTHPFGSGDLLLQPRAASARLSFGIPKKYGFIVSNCLDKTMIRYHTIINNIIPVVLVSLRLLSVLACKAFGRTFLLLLVLQNGCGADLSERLSKTFTGSHG